jgi:hypothetical protein
MTDQTCDSVSKDKGVPGNEATSIFEMFVFTLHYL